MFNVNGYTFDFDYSFPPTNTEGFQPNTMMVASVNGVMTVYGWNCLLYPDNADVWLWEPLFSLNEKTFPKFLELIKSVEKNNK